MLKIATPTYSEALDKAVESCLTTDNGRLVEVSIHCGREALTPPNQIQGLLNGLKANYTVQKVSLNDIVYGIADGDAIWDIDQVAMVECILLLNRSGRSYLNGNAQNLEMGIQVLQAVSEDLNAIFFHLRENPFFVLRSA